MPARNAWARKSGVVSISTFFPPYCTRIEGRSRLSRGSVEAQVAQLQPMVGTPELVPDPSTVMRRDSDISGRRGRVLRVGGLFSGRLRGLLRRLLFGYLDETEAQFREGVFDE